MSAPGDDAVIRWAAAGRALDGDVPGAESGDLHVVVPNARGALVAVIDGLGHGTEAAIAARAAGAVLETEIERPLDTMFERCHERIRHTRGVVMTLVWFDARLSSMTWAGIGNVEAILVRAGRPVTREALASRGGVVGYQLPRVRPSTLPLAPGDTVFLATDGLRSAFVEDLPVRAEPQEAADYLLARYARPHDDALVVVVQFRGGSDGEPR